MISKDTIELRDYQKESINAILNAFKTDKRALLQLSTGLGKTCVLTALIELIREHKPNFRALVLVHKVVLIKQTIEKFSRESDVSYICSTLGETEIKDTPFVVASIQTLHEKRIPNFDLIITDECHVQTMAHRKIYEKLPNAKILGLSATPWDMKGFIYGPDKRWPEPCYKNTKEIEDKYLCPITLKGTTEKVDLTGLYGTEYSLLKAAERYEDDLVERQVSDLLSKTTDRNSVVIVACNIEHCERIEAVLKKRTPDVVKTHSQMKKGEQAIALNLFSTGEARFLISVNQISVGCDIPRIDAIAIMRPTRSLSLMVQIIGRGRRKFKGKLNCLILDYGNIIQSIGLPEDAERNVTEKKPSCKLCPLCETFLPTSQEVCSCGFSFILPPSVQRGASDYEKNLSVYAYTEGENVSAITTAWHISAKGNRCLKVMFWQGMKMLYAEYLMPYQRDKINKLLERIIYPRFPYASLENVREQILKADMIVKSIVLKKEGRYKVLHQTRW